MLVAAVAPLAILTAVYAWSAGDSARRAEMRARFETARVVAGVVETMVEGPGRAIDLLLTDPGLAGDPVRCDAAGRRLLRLVETVTDVDVVAGGRRVCALAHGPEGIVAAMGGGTPVVEARTDAVLDLGGAGGRPAIRLARAPSGEAGSLAVAHVGLGPIWQRAAASVAGLDDAHVFILTRSGGVIADPSGAVDTAAISAVVAAVATARQDGVPVVRTDVTGGSYVAVARVGATSLHVAVTSRAGGVEIGTVARIALAAGMPLLFLVAAVGIAWLGVDRLVARWLRRFGRVARRYGDGDLAARVGPVPTAPEEIRAVGRSFDEMAARVEARSGELEKALAEKNHFVRELHHRVKNNFQMIASLLTLQRREADPSVEAAIREAHDRVQALASAYRASYADGETGSVPLSDLLSDLVERLRESARLSSRAVLLDGLDTRLTAHLDRAIPFALLMTEILVPLFDRPGVEDESIVIRLARADAAAGGPANPILVEIRTTLPVEPSARPLSERLARAYAGQLATTVRRTPGLIEILLPPDP
ncbi:histidine kinase [Pleomorphomonas sp. SM30]|uniref:histidine kinase n=4 Tax=Oharaeibacter diazotrophicus TaxID=1920512 RepID=A0A4V3CVS1_9HYPH|nr:HAMP domain-containing protein [Oharaeibacter diazotrophicus]BBE72411.1 histidine kinase [Pleomorphomonas sp. SM30]GLS79181.1 hypothetical protein GCM10007904_45180 [Oharaeibacter diazotrophicus]